MASWTPEQAGQFREHVRDERLVAYWLLTLAGLRRSEVLGLRWSDVDLDAGTASVAQGRVVVPGSGHHDRRSEVKAVPAGVADARRRSRRASGFKVQQASERLALGERYPDTGFVAVNEDGSPVRPEIYSAEFARLAKAAGVPAIRQPQHDMERLD